MPCNGLTYAPPHNCACYPEAKLFGFNALAPLLADSSDSGQGSGGRADWKKVPLLVPRWRLWQIRNRMTGRPIDMIRAAAARRPSRSTPMSD